MRSGLRSCGHGQTVIVTHREKNHERLADKIRRRKQEKSKDYKIARDIYYDIIDLSGGFSWNGRGL
jgi:hypothetical protein